jgi:hypothetical protein
MKLNIGCGDNVRHGYLNVDSDARNLPKDVYAQGNKGNIDWLCEDSSCDEIVSSEAIRLFNHDYLRKAVIPNWCKKLKQNGAMKLSFSDGYSFARLLAQNKISTEQYNNIIFGSGEGFKSTICEQLIISILLENEMSIVSKKYDGLLFYVEATKNG